MKRILVVEDDSSFLSFLVGTLQEVGYLVQPAQTIKTAANWLGDIRPDLAIVDIGLSDGNGLDFCRDVKKSPETRNIPVIVLTGAVGNHFRIEAAIRGVDLYLDKPLDLEDLVWAAKVLLGSKGTSKLKRGILRIGNFEIDPERRTIFYGGKTVKNLADTLLFDVLYILVQHHPRTVSKRRLVDIIHPGDRDKEVEVWISRLRDRLGEFLGCDFIETVPREGYRFKLPSPIGVATIGVAT